MRRRRRWDQGCFFLPVEEQGANRWRKKISRKGLAASAAELNAYGYLQSEMGRYQGELKKAGIIPSHKIVLLNHGSHSRPAVTSVIHYPHHLAPASYANVFGEGDF